jgi:hypothetical protein
MEHADIEPNRVTLSSARRWCTRELAPLIESDAEHRADSAAFEG